YVAAIQMGVAYAIGNVFYTNGCGSYRLRVNYAAQQPAEIEEGFKRLGRAWRELAADYADMSKAPLLDALRLRYARIGVVGRRAGANRSDCNTRGFLL